MWLAVSDCKSEVILNRWEFESLLFHQVFILWGYRRTARVGGLRIHVKGWTFIVSWNLTSLTIFFIYALVSQQVEEMILKIIQVKVRIFPGAPYVTVAECRCTGLQTQQRGLDSLQ